LPKLPHDASLRSLDWRRKKMMMGAEMLKLDHVAVAGETLAEATDLVENALGVSLQGGGKHAAFGTHNRLLGLADGLYLEAIAIDPDAPNPPHARWFDMDRFTGRARLTNWICRTADMARALGDLPMAGNPVDLARGDLAWIMAVPSDGMLPYDNRFPALIQWHGDSHPASRLEQVGCALRRLVIVHPHAQDLANEMALCLNDTRVVFETGVSEMQAEIDTPHGLRVLA
jgi:hypothetical protein